MYESDKRYWCQQVKSDRGCALCATPHQLVFHYIKPRPSATEGFQWSGASPTEIETEIALCAVLCQPCRARYHGYRSTERLPKLSPVVLTTDERMELHSLQQQQHSNGASGART